MMGPEMELGVPPYVGGAGRNGDVGQLGFWLALETAAP